MEMVTGKMCLYKRRSLWEFNIQMAYIVTVLRCSWHSSDYAAEDLVQRRPFVKILLKLVGLGRSDICRRSR